MTTTTEKMSSSDAGLLRPLRDRVTEATTKDDVCAFPFFGCYMCERFANTNDVLNRHIAGGEHIKTARRLNINRHDEHAYIVRIDRVQLEPTNRVAVLQAQMDAIDDVLIGIEYATEILSEFKTPSVSCTLCGHRMTDGTAIAHLTGNIHRYNVLAKHAPDSAKRIDAVASDWENAADADAKRKIILQQFDMLTTESVKFAQSHPRQPLVQKRIRMPPRPRFNLESILSSIPDIAARERRFHCVICRFVSGSAPAQLLHVLSRKHRDRYNVLVANGVDMTYYANEIAEADRQNAKAEDHPRPSGKPARVQFDLDAFTLAPLIGMQFIRGQSAFYIRPYITEIVYTSNEEVYLCSVCSSIFTYNEFFKHASGRNHQLKSVKAMDPGHTISTADSSPFDTPVDGQKPDAFEESRRARRAYDEVLRLKVVQLEKDQGRGKVEQMISQQASHSKISSSKNTRSGTNSFSRALRAQADGSTFADQMRMVEASTLSGYSTAQADETTEKICTVCSVKCSGITSYNDHLAGQKHMRMLADKGISTDKYRPKTLAEDRAEVVATLGYDPNDPQQRPSGRHSMEFYCYVCKVANADDAALKRHNEGLMHEGVVLGDYTVTGASGNDELTCQMCTDAPKILSGEYGIRAHSQHVAEHIAVNDERRAIPAEKLRERKELALKVLLKNLRIAPIAYLMRCRATVEAGVTAAKAAGNYNSDASMCRYENDSSNNGAKRARYSDVGALVEPGEHLSYHERHHSRGGARLSQPHGWMQPEYTAAMRPAPARPYSSALLQSPQSSKFEPIGYAPRSSRPTLLPDVRSSAAHQSMPGAPVAKKKLIVTGRPATVQKRLDLCPYALVGLSYMVEIVGEPCSYLCNLCRRKCEPGEWQVEKHVGTIEHLSRWMAAHNTEIYHHLVTIADSEQRARELREQCARLAATLPRECIVQKAEV